jgi:hypothetical protein
MPFDNVLAAQLTVTALPAKLAVGVAATLTVDALEAPLPPGPELAFQYAHAPPPTRVKTKAIASNDDFSMLPRARVARRLMRCCPRLRVL